MLVDPLFHGGSRFYFGTAVQSIAFYCLPTREKTPRNGLGFFLISQNGLMHNQTLSSGRLRPLEAHGEK